MRRALWVLLAAAALGAGGWALWETLRGFQLSGSVTAAPRFQKRIETPNMVLFVVAQNSGRVPVAVKRVVNPKLPLRWEMGPEDLILPGRDWEGPISVRVLINSHGKAGVVLKGDLFGDHRHPVRSGDGSVDVVIDTEAP